ncbi:MAG: phosphoglucomutase [Clostridia bacterium BRH_c25]|nr:MAG: phosphoglucomutase [Clostridia bacterium BRH_c25]
MSYYERYNKWITDAAFDEETRKELMAIKGNDKDIEDRFYKDLEFGTGGLRGVIGAGTNRMNKYTVGRATQGLANYIIKKRLENPSVVIAYDSRRFSYEFAIEAARVLNSNGIIAYVFNELRPTPELSFAVRELRATAGIVITASHNPPQYNGYKVYWSDGGQVVSPIAEELIAEANSIQDFSEIKCMDECYISNKGLLRFLGKEMDDRYIGKVRGLALNSDVVKEVGDDFGIIYTPLHGAGNIPVRRALKETGFNNVTVVPEQELPDQDFRTVKFPNPEEHEAFTLAIELAGKQSADIIIGTDPDCDRVGVVVKNTQGEYVVLTGNQTGALLVDYILGSMQKQGRLNERSTIINTIVTGKLGAKIAESYNVGTISVLTGFKYIAEKIKEFENTGREFIFGYEESYGYLAGTFVRDKDAVITSMLICEMAACYKKKGMTLYEGLMNLYSKYGYYKESLSSITFKGKEGMEEMVRLIDGLRSNPPGEVNGIKVTEVRDYLDYNGTITLPKENVLQFILEDKSWFCIRPSGTEPKLKIYFSVTGESNDAAEARMAGLRAGVEVYVEV